MTLDLQFPFVSVQHWSTTFCTFKDMLIISSKVKVLKSSVFFFFFLNSLDAFLVSVFHWQVGRVDLYFS